MMNESARAWSSRAARLYDELPIGEESCHDVMEALRKLLRRRGFASPLALVGVPAEPYADVIRCAT